ncbi:hypothetical protein AB4440_04810 [Vibrio splendidus]|uniref:hypothetical protein n=1 Tax=Vibrio splendidus TaxID=29497 RepID=UPI000C82FBAD|nr:hypothetical protein [Vibrio splendidus]PMO95787.1 hypothetical protein BCS97_14155 [Vibrio splendidus]PMP24590.1 hypothetical protein BCS89_15285 [Vibrio splendidus]PMP30120.1 hypothetical protein BCS88_19230 [Vibrio splendidus]PMP39635.1 hypothetical protein BCS87_09355 [Vibrio splendidus]PMP50112.1 hypothetical protein BCS85_05720 [Vibrio splendidus]
MTIEKFLSIYESNGFETEVNGDAINLKLNDVTFYFTLDDEWKKQINSYYKAQQYQFDEEKQRLTAYRKVEFRVVRLDPAYFSRTEHEFSDERNNTVRVNSASHEFVLALLGANKGETITSIVKKRLQRRAERPRNQQKEEIRIRIEDLLVIPMTASYCVRRKIHSEKLIEQGYKKVKSCLFKLSYMNNECWELKESIKTNTGTISLDNEDDLDSSIPRASYSEDLVSYYKVAVSSQYPSQAFLSYYHILEYHFLRVSEQMVFETVKSHVNNLNFVADYQNINKLLSIVKGSDITNDETEMLKLVLRKYVDEDDLISHIKEIESKSNSKIYSKGKKTIFGAGFSIRLEQGHALSNIGSIIKHIRNALVHSSDKYSREDCFLPFSESESTVIEYLPIVKFLAEQVIFSTAE